MKHFTRSLKPAVLLSASMLGLWAPAVLGADPVPAAPAATPAAVQQERWYVLELNGAKTGYMRESIATNAAGQRVTDQEVVFTMARAGQNIQITMSTGFVENADGSPASMSMAQNLGLMKLSSKFEFTPEGVVEESDQAGVKTRTVHPKIEGEWLTPSRVEKFVSEKLGAGEKAFAFKTVSPTSGAKAFDTTVKVLDAATQAEGFGKTVPAVKWETEASVMPGAKSTEWVDMQGRPIRSEVQIAGMDLTMLVADKDVATSKFAAPEAMAQTTIVPQGEFQAPSRKTTSAIYTVESTERLPDFPTAGGQRTTRQHDQVHLVKVDVDWPVEQVEPLSDPRPFMSASKACNSEDPEIVKLAAKAVEGAGPKPIDRAKALRRFVYSHIEKKNLGVGFATASEVARTKQGDCSEHAVLLAALLRAQGIPSRVVSGIIHTEEFEGQRNVFVYHMWTQAFLPAEHGHYWLDIDATLPDNRVFDAAHIALNSSSLADDDVLNSMVALSELIGKLRVRVEVGN